MVASSAALFETRTGRIDVFVPLDPEDPFVADREDHAHRHPLAGIPRAGAKMTISVGQPLHLREKLGRDADAEDAYELVTTSMQRMLTRLGRERSVPGVG